MKNWNFEIQKAFFKILKIVKEWKLINQKMTSHFKQLFFEFNLNSKCWNLKTIFVYFCQETFLDNQAFLNFLFNNNNFNFLKLKKLFFIQNLREIPKPVTISMNFVDQKLFKTSVCEKLIRNPKVLSELLC